MNTKVQNNLNASRVAKLNVQLLEQVENLFLFGGITVPMKLLADLFSELSEAARKSEAEDGPCRDYIADKIFQGTQIMALLAEMYETYSFRKMVESEKGEVA